MKRFLLIAIVIGATVVACGWWYHRRQLLSDRRIAAAQAAAVEAALQERIDTADFAGEDRPWGGVLEVLQSRCDVPLVVDEDEAESMGVDRQTRVNVPDGVFPLDELLDEITGRMDLSWRPSEGGIEITSVSIAEPSRNRLITRVYPLPAGTAAGEKLTDNARALCEWIHNMIEPDSWQEVGGEGAIEPAGGALVVRQTERVHRQIRQVLAQMQSLPNLPSRQLEADPLAVEERERVEHVLAQRASVEFKDKPLNDAIDELAARFKLRIRLSAETLSICSVNPTARVNMSLSKVPLRTVLIELLAAQKLTYTIRNGSLIVLTTVEAESRFNNLFYDVRDLDSVIGGSDFDTLIDLLMTTVEPDSWDEVGGPGTITHLGDRWLVVSQTQAIQQKVKRLLARLRALLQPGVDPGADALLEPIDDLAPAIEKALDREVTLEHAGMPLVDVCRDLSLQLAIPVLPRMRPDSTTALDAPVTIDLPPLPLRDSLALLLAEHQLTFDPRGEVLYITTPEDAENNLVTRIIDVRHLVDPASGGFDEDTIIDLVTTCVEPDMWDEVGGPGSEEIFRGLLVFRQTYDVSRQVQELIEALSEHCLPPPCSREAKPTDAPLRPVWIDASGQVERIVEALTARVSLHLEPPIEPSIRRLCDEHGIPCVFDRQWLMDARVDVPWPGYVLDAADQPLAAILSKLAESKEGGIAIAHGALLITDQVSAASQGLPRLYPAGGLSVDGEMLTADQVADMLSERVEPDTWSSNGGYGIILPVGDEWLLVVQTLTMHRRVEEALKKLERGEILPLPSPESIMLRRLRRRRRFLEGLHAVEELSVDFPQDAFIGYPPSSMRKAK